VDLVAFRSEASALVAGLGRLPEGGWAAPTRCAPWDVRDLLGHVHVAVARLPSMLAEPAPPRALVTAVEYYRPDERFGAAVTAGRIDSAREHAAAQTGEAALAGFATMCESVARLCEREPAARVVRTRHGDAMLLSEFLTTRVVELALHGLDLADAIAAPAWLTPAAAALLQDLLLGPGRSAPDPERFIRAATGRGSDPDLLRRLRPRLLTLA
jgi:uncharacterized protein (TIGR03083 family)